MLNIYLDSLGNMTSMKSLIEELWNIFKNVKWVKIDKN